MLHVTELKCVFAFPEVSRDERRNAAQDAPTYVEEDDIHVK